MAMHHFFNPIRFGTELAYTILVVFLCLLVYYKTKDMYNLTKHKGIQYFRNAFLFFGLAYASRFLLHSIQLSLIAFDYFIPRGMMFPVFMVPVGYLSTMAIFYLMYSTIWKKIQYKHFLIFSNLFAVIFSLVAFISRSPIKLLLLQLALLAFTIFFNSKKGKKKTNTRVLYLLIAIFWLVNIFALSPGRFLPFEFKFLFQIISLVVFFVIYSKVKKWVK